jgi:polysaccharide biosynthesis transport protein
MEGSEYPLKKAAGRSGLSMRGDERPVGYPYVKTFEPGPPNYDNFSDYWHLLARYKLTLLTFTLGGLLAAILISLIETPIYRARTSLEIQSPDFLELKGVDTNNAEGNYPTPETYVETQVKLLQSESLLEDVINKLKLRQARQATGWHAIALRVRHLFRRSNPSQLAEGEQIVKKVRENLTVQIAGKSRLIEVLYESPDRQLAADFANTLVNEFIELSQDERWKSAQGTAQWLTSHLDQMKSQLEASEARLQEYAVSAGLSPTSEQDTPAESRLKQLLDDMSQAQADRIAKQAKYEQARSKPTDSLPELQEDSTMRDYRERLTQLQRQYAELSVALTPQHPKMQGVQAQINELKSAMRQERANVLRRVGDEYFAAVRRERLLQEACANQEKIVADQSSKSIHYDTLKRDVDSNRRLYELMLQRVKEASLASAMRDSNVLVVDRAQPPLLPYRPSLPMNSAIGLLSGMFLGFAFMLVRERIDRRITAPGDAQVYLGLPELGVIPLDGPAGSVPLLDRLNLHRPAGSLSTASTPHEYCPELATWKRKPSLLAECARTTLISILLPRQNGDAPQVIVCTSPGPGDGKTTVACNLSIAMAEIGRLVLLIEGDLRRPRLYKVFGTSNQSGLSDLLRTETPLETAPIAHLVHKTDVTGLFLLPGGSCGVNPANLFYSSPMRRLLHRLRKEFDMIMIDAPPMIHLADARVLGCLSDGVILVVRAGQTTTESALFARQRFEEDGTRVLGTVLNSWNPRTGRRYGYGSYADYQEHLRQ